MKNEQILKYLNKKVRFFMADGTLWTGSLLSVEEENSVLRDKFWHKVTICNGDVKAISEWGVLK